MHFTISADAADSKCQAIQRHASLMCREMSNDHTAVAYSAGFLRTARRSLRNETLVTRVLGLVSLLDAVAR